MEKEKKKILAVLDLRKIPDGDAVHVVSHRYGMMSEGQTIALVTAKMPLLIRGVFHKRFAEKHIWEDVGKEDGKFLAYLTKLETSENECVH